MKCIAIDDEPIALALIRRYCERRGGMELETYTHPRLGMQRIKEVRPDLVFLDVEMNGVSGVELARELPPSCFLVFTTAYAHYAFDGFELDAVDFLHKPFFYERFDRAVQKVEERLRARRLAASCESSERQLVLKVEYKNVIVSLDDILYIEAMNNYVRLHRLTQPALLSQTSLTHLMERLPAGEFVRVHRSFAVAVNKVTGFIKQGLVLMGSSVRIPIGKRYADEVCRLLRNRP